MFFLLPLLCIQIGINLELECKNNLMCISSELKMYPYIFYRELQNYEPLIRYKGTKNEHSKCTV